MAKRSEESKRQNMLFQSRQTMVQGNVKEEAKKPETEIAKLDNKEPIQEKKIDKAEINTEEIKIEKEDTNKVEEIKDDKEKVEKKQIKKEKTNKSTEKKESSKSTTELDDYIKEILVPKEEKKGKAYSIYFDTDVAEYINNISTKYKVNRSKVINDLLRSIINK